MTGRLLVLGGTSWLGGAVATEALRQGYDVVCLARGESGAVPDGARLVAADRWRPGAYADLGTFDAAVEVTWQPELARSALAEVHATHWVYVSSVSVYADDPPDALLSMWDESGEAPREAYGGAKVACEAAYAEALDSASYLVARVGLIGGYGDRSDRLGYWPARIDAARGSRQHVLVPPLESPVQVIDVLDAAAWLVHCASHRVSGTFDTVGPAATLREVLSACEVATGAHPSYVEASADQLQSAGVSPWMGLDSLPLWAPGHEDVLVRSSTEAEHSGLTLRPLSDTVSAALTWEREHDGIARNRTSGLSAERESQVIKLL